MDDEKMLRKVEALQAEIVTLRREVEQFRPSLRSGIEGLAARQERLAGMVFMAAFTWATTALEEEDVARLMAKLHAAWKGGQAVPAGEQAAE